MNLHLAEIAAQTAPGTHTRRFSSIRPAGICRAGFRHAAQHHLDPVAGENVRSSIRRKTSAQFLRDNWLSNRIFKSYDDVVDHCCEAWNNLVDQPWRIMSIGLRNWAHGS